MRRLGAVVRLRPEKAEEYERLHADVPAEVLSMLRAAHLRNYSIFRRGDLPFGYMEYTGTDLDADLARIAADPPATRRWWQLTDPCQQPMPGAAIGELWSDLDQIFFME
jgi:L-rhamnose mutarotase